MSDPYHNVFREEIVAEGTIIKVDFVERLFRQLHHITLVVAAILVLAYHLLSHSQLMHGCFIALSEQIEDITFL